MVGTCLLICERDVVVIWVLLRVVDGGGGPRNGRGIRHLGLLIKRKFGRERGSPCCGPTQYDL